MRRRLPTASVTARAAAVSVGGFGRTSSIQVRKRKAKRGAERRNARRKAEK